MKLKKTGNLLVQMLMFTIGSTASKKLLWRSILAICLLPGLAMSAQAQTITREDGTPNGTLIPATNGIIKIDGGTQTGANLFHSFKDFGVKAGETANFVRPNDVPGILPVTNILGRVSGSNPSVIDGKIQVTGGNANLYLMNPAGIVFGKGASLDVNGAFTATTANAIGFGNNLFNAFGNNNYAALTGNPGDLAFTTTQPGSIFNAANLVTKPGNSITLVGGTVISTGKIVTQGGNITIATVPGPFVRFRVDGSVLALDFPIASSINPLPTNFKPTTLPALLTGSGIDLTATGVKIEGGVVRLFTDPNLKIAVGDTVTKANRQISNGDVITADLNTSIPSPANSPTTGSLGSSQNPFTARQPAQNGGDIRIESNNAILTGSIDTSNKLFVVVRNEKGSGGNGGSIAMTARTEIKAGNIVSLTENSNNERFLTDPKNLASGRRPTETEIATLQPRGGNVTISTKTGDLIVDSIETRAGIGFVGDGNKEGSKSNDFQYPNRGGDLTVKASGLFRVVKYIPSSFIGVDTAPFGNINISHRGKSFVVGASLEDKKLLDSLASQGFIQIPAPPDFTFPDGASGSLGVIVSSKFGNGSVATFYNGQNIAGITIGVAEGDKGSGKDDTTKPKSETQICDRSANSSSTNQATSTDSTPNTSSADPCNQNANSSAILQILNSKKSN